MKMADTKKIKELRARTGVGILDCKKALIESSDDIEEAIALLRKRGIAKAAAKSDRQTSEGLISASVFANKTATIIEVNAETDFVARNDIFQTLVKNISSVSENTKNLEELLAAKLPSGNSVDEEVKNSVLLVGENINLSRMEHITLTEGVIGKYVHNSKAEGLGTKASLVALKTTLQSPEILDLAQKIAMHIVANRPKYLTKEDIPEELVNKEKEIYIEQVADKPEHIQDKIVHNKLEQWKSENSLLYQNFFIDTKIKIIDLIQNKSQELGAEIRINSFVLYEIGQNT